MHDYVRRQTNYFLHSVGVLPPFHCYAKLYCLVRGARMACRAPYSTGDVAQWLGRQSVAGGLSMIYA